MQAVPRQKENPSANWITWLLSTIAGVLLIVIIYQHIQIKNSQNNFIDSGTVPKAATVQVESVSVSQQQEDYEKTIQQLQAQLKDLLTASIEASGTGRSGAIPPPDGAAGGGTGGDRGIIDRRYTPLLTRLNLSSEERDKFQDFLIERRKAWLEIENEIINLSVSEDYLEDLKKELEDLAWEYDEKALELLGYKNYQKYNEYNSCRGIFISDPVDEFKGMLSTEEEINYFQEEQLTTAMAEEFEDFMASTVPEAKGPPGFRVGMRGDKEINSKIVAGLDDLQEKYFSRARTILSESQMNIFEVFIKITIKARKSSYLNYSGVK